MQPQIFSYLKQRVGSALERDEDRLSHLMASNQSTRQGAKRRAMWGIGQASQRWRWADLAHRRPVFHARRASLRPAYGRPDHGADRASSADVKNRSNGST